MLKQLLQKRTKRNQQNPMDLSYNLIYQKQIKIQDTKSFNNNWKRFHKELLLCQKLYQK